MSFLEYIIDLTLLDWTIEFSHQPFNISIKITKQGIERISWLPYEDHCSEKRIKECIAWMVDEIRKEITP